MKTVCMISEAHEAAMQDLRDAAEKRRQAVDAAHAAREAWGTAKAAADAAFKLEEHASKVAARLAAVAKLANRPEPLA